MLDKKVQMPGQRRTAGALESRGPLALWVRGGLLEMLRDSCSATERRRIGYSSLNMHSDVLRL
jgi:hypothetical protein